MELPTPGLQEGTPMSSLWVSPDWAPWARAKARPPAALPQQGAKQTRVWFQAGQVWKHRACMFFHAYEHHYSCFYFIFFMKATNEKLVVSHLWICCLNNMNWTFYLYLYSASVSSLTEVSGSTPSTAMSSTRPRHTKSMSSSGHPSKSTLPPIDDNTELKARWAAE